MTTGLSLFFLTNVHSFLGSDLSCMHCGFIHVPTSTTGIMGVGDGVRRTHLSSSGQGPQAASSPPGSWAPTVLLISITPTLPKLEVSFLRRRSLTLAPTTLPRFLRCWLLPTLSPGPPDSGVMEPGAPGLDRWGKEWLAWSFGVRVVFKFSNML